MVTDWLHWILQSSKFSATKIQRKNLIDDKAKKFSGVQNNKKTWIPLQKLEDEVLADIESEEICFANSEISRCNFTNWWKILFIEFKNGKIKDKQNDSIVIKILESLLMFCDIADCKISQVREVADLILVYNAEKNPPHSKSFKNFADEIGELTREKNVFSRNINFDWSRI